MVITSSKKEKKENADEINEIVVDKTGKVVISETPEFLRNMREVILKSLAETDQPEKAVKDFEFAWGRYRKEAEYFLNLLRSEHKDSFEGIEQHYQLKMNCLVKERKGLKASHRLFLSKVKADLKYRKSRNYLDYFVWKRFEQVNDIVIPGITHITPIFGPDFINLLDSVHQEALAGSKAFNKAIRNVTHRIIAAYRKQRIRRWGYRMLFEMFWGFLILTLLADQVFQKSLEEHLPIALKVNSVALRFILLLIITFTLYLVKDKVLNPRLHKYLSKLRFRNLADEIYEAAQVQTRLEAMYIIKRFMEDFERKSRSQEKESHNSSIDENSSAITN